MERLSDADHVAVELVRAFEGANRNAMCERNASECVAELDVMDGAGGRCAIVGGGSAGDFECLAATYEIAGKLVGLFER